MKFSIKLCSLALGCACFCAPLSAMSAHPRAAVVVESSDYDDASYQIWIGPGWYYGLWFDNEIAYYRWLDKDFYKVVWVGPGWYYGYWFDFEFDFYNYRHHHRRYHHDGRRHHHKGSPSHHKSQHHGHWRKDAMGGHPDFDT